MTTQTTSQLPIAPGKYSLFAGFSGVFFQMRILGINDLRGSFNHFDASMQVGETLQDVHIDATVDVDSLDTNEPGRDKHMQTADFFDAEHHPQMVFHSTGVSHVSGDHYKMLGDLSIRGITKPITLDVRFNGSEDDPHHPGLHVGFTATGVVRRSAYGIDFNIPLGAGKFAMSDDVKVELEIQLVGEVPAAPEA